MQDEHFLKAWNEGHATFSTDLATVTAALRGQCRKHLARLLSRAIPLGILAGAALAAAAAIGEPMKGVPVLAEHPITASNFALPYPA